MPEVDYTLNPKITDTVIFDLEIFDGEDLVDPYKINQVTIYFVERAHFLDGGKIIEKDFEGNIYTDYYSQANPVGIFGDDLYPAWLSTDTENAFLERISEGVFRLKWVPELCREGDYFICYTWTLIPAGDSESKSITFYLRGDTAISTSTPLHRTVEGKYEKLLDRYLPEMFKNYIGPTDLTPEVLGLLSSAVADGFTTIEDLVNQMVDLLDANAVNDDILIYLGNLFNLTFKSTDTTLWRRQVKEAVRTFKKKGSLQGLKDSLSAAGIRLISFKQLWQVASPWTFTESFKVEDSSVFVLKKLANLPVNSNYEVSIRFVGDDFYTELTTDYVDFVNDDFETVVTWVGDNLSVNPIALTTGDFVKIRYEISPVENQTIEDYIQSLPLYDQRDEAEIDLPGKNFNIHAIEEDDEGFEVVCPSRHDFNYPVVWGKIRTEFPYSENVFNMEEHNASLRDSLNPCDIDKNFLDSCSCCMGSKFIINVEIDKLTNERLQEVRDIIKDCVPFHFLPFEIQYSGSLMEFVPSPVEEVEILVSMQTTSNIISMQTEFNRLIEEGDDYSEELNRSSLASTSVYYSGTGTGSNESFTLYSPGIRFDAVTVDADDSYLEILSGINTGEYTVSNPTAWTVDVNQTLTIDASEIPFRLSNELYSEATASVFQDDEYKFSDSDITFVSYGIMDSWKIKITSGIYAGVYDILSINSDNTINIENFTAISSVSGLNYELRNESNIVVYSGIGAVEVLKRGRVEIDSVTEQLGIIQTDYIKIGSSQYRIKFIIKDTVDSLYIEDYEDGDIVPVSIVVYRRVLDNKTGYIGLRGMVLNGTIPDIDYSLENNKFMENYLIKIGSDYYQIAAIDGSDMFLNGKFLEWGVTGTSVNYDIVQLIKQAATTQDGHEFEYLDRRGNESISFTVETQMSMSAAGMAAGLNNNFSDSVGQTEDITFTIERRGE